MRERCKHLLAVVGITLLAGLAYFLIYTILGVGFPCLIYRRTGLYCPSCGVTRMCVALIRLDFAGAWHSNPALMLCLPFLAYLVVQNAVHYLRTGELTPMEKQRVLVWGLMIFLLIFGVVRNF